MFHEFDAIIEEMRLVYKHDQRPWMLGYSGGKDSTLLCQLVFEMLLTLAPEERTKKLLNARKKSSNASRRANGCHGPP